MTLLHSTISLIMYYTIRHKLIVKYTSLKLLFKKYTFEIIRTHRPAGIDSNKYLEK